MRSAGQILHNAPRRFSRSDTVTDERDTPKKTLKDRAWDLVEGLLGALDDVLPAPTPPLAPIPVDVRRRRPR